MARRSFYARTYNALLRHQQLVGRHTLTKTERRLLVAQTGEERNRLEAQVFLFHQDELRTRANSANTDDRKAICHALDVRRSSRGRKRKRSI